MSGIIAAAGITAAAGIAASQLSKSGGGGGGTQTQTQQTQIPFGIQQRDSDNWDLAVQAANQLMGPYGGQRVASMTPEQRNLIAQLYGNVGSTNPAYAQAQGATSGLLGFNPSTVDPRMLAGTDLSPYMNPYTKNVIDPTMSLMEQSRKQALMGIGDTATQAKAFGGSRQGIAEGVTNAQSELQKGQFAGGLLSQNFAQAQQGAQYDIGNRFTADQFNSQMGLAGAQFRGGMANQLAGLATQGQNTYLQGLQAAMGGQGLLQAQSQAELDAQRQHYMEQRQQPLDVLAIRQNALAQSPYGQMSTTTSPGPSTNPLSTGLGMSAATAGLLGQMGMFNKAPVNTDAVMREAIPRDVWSQYGVTSSPWSLSDRRLKTDIKKLGRDPKTDIDLYAYRYKGDPKNYPLVVGPMAQDVAKKYPDQVVKAGKYLGIKTNFLSGMAA